MVAPLRGLCAASMPLKRSRQALGAIYLQHRSEQLKLALMAIAIYPRKTLTHGGIRSLVFDHIDRFDDEGKGASRKITKIETVKATR